MSNFVDHISQAQITIIIMKTIESTKRLGNNSSQNKMSTDLLSR